MGVSVKRNKFTWETPPLEQGSDKALVDASAFLYAQYSIKKGISQLFFRTFIMFNIVWYIFYVCCGRFVIKIDMR